MAPVTAAVTGKRKREDVPAKTRESKKLANASAVKTKRQTADARAAATGPPVEIDDEPMFIQIVTGSYERVLHGITAAIPRHLLHVPPDTNETSEKPTESPNGTETGDVTFSDTFLFAAHASSVRCLAVSPPTESDKRFVATGSSDERINLYSVSTVPPKIDPQSRLPSLAANAVTENSRNRSLGSLIHHDRAITHLDFPAKGKLFSAAEDNTIAISRTRDWTVLSSIKAPIPKPQGRPSGDTAGPGDMPAGVNDFAIHPSQKLMLSVGRGERSLRLWNLMTGKKAGVLNFDRSLLEQAGETRYSSGEGRRVLWAMDGEAYVVGFERGAAVFGIDSKPRAIIRPSPTTKFHQLRTVPTSGKETDRTVLAASTEDGRLLFYDIDAYDKFPLDSPEAGAKQKLPLVSCLAELGGPIAGISGRIKDFEILSLLAPSLALPSEGQAAFLVVTASSDGAVRLWALLAEDIFTQPRPEELAEKAAEFTPKQVGKLIGTLETGSRITCLGAFPLDGRSTGNIAEEQDGAGVGADDDDDSSDASSGGE